MRTIEVFENSRMLSLGAAELFVGIANEAAREKGWFAVALAGGSTPKELYRLLYGEEFRGRVRWSKAKLFVGDERNVGEGAEESNFRMITENLVEPLGLSSNLLVGWDVGEERKGGISAAAVAEAFCRKLEREFDPVPDAKELPRFDLVLLGMGSDAHTASLFPHTEALQETGKPAVANWVEKLDSFRYTITFPLINNAANVIFLVAGNDKAEAARNVLEGERRPDEFPAQSVNPKAGRLYWLLDAEAASLLNRK